MNSVQSDPLLNRGEETNMAPKAGMSTRRKTIMGVLLICVLAGFMLAASRRTPAHSAADDGVVIECPSSSALFHAQCSMTFQINDFMCSDVKEEAERRIQGKDGWVDPKSHPGKYLLLGSEPTKTMAQRTTGDGSNYVDKFTFTYTDVEGKGCLVTGCSVAQSTSYYDYSTNYCNMHNVLCGKTENCKVSRHDIRQPIEKYSSCPFHDVTMCTR